METEPILAHYNRIAAGGSILNSIIDDEIKSMFDTDRPREFDNESGELHMAQFILSSDAPPTIECYLLSKPEDDCVKPESWGEIPEEYLDKREIVDFFGETQGVRVMRLDSYDDYGEFSRYMPRSLRGYEEEILRRSKV